MSSGHAAGTVFETKWMVSTLFALALIIHHSPFMLAFLIGSTANAVMSKILKKLFKQARPTGAKETDHGMPSSHAMALFFNATFLSVAALDIGDDALHQIDVFKLFRLPSSLTPAALSICLEAVAAFGSIHRVRSGLHTFAQVFVGMVAGRFNANIWYRLSSMYLIPWFASSTHWHIWSWLVIIPLGVVGWVVVAVGGKQYTRDGLRGVQWFAPLRLPKKTAAPTPTPTQPNNHRHENK